MVGYHVPVKRSKRKADGDAVVVSTWDDLASVRRRFGDSVQIGRVLSAFRHVAEGSVSSRIPTERLLDVWSLVTDLESEAIAHNDISDLSAATFSGCIGLTRSKEKQVMVTNRFIQYVSSLLGAPT